MWTGRELRYNHSEAYDYAGPATGTFTASTTGGSIDIVNPGIITTTGAGSHGIYAQTDASAYASGGGTATATGGDMTLDSSGTLSATGNDSTGTYAVSYGGTSNGDLTINVLGGNVSGGTASGAGVRFEAGDDNQLNNYGAISALSQLAVSSSGGDETINNYGLITGNVELGSGTNAFNNVFGGTFRSGSYANLGSSNTLTDAGNLTPGGAGAVQTTSVAGILVQTGTGTYSVDVDEGAAQQADLVTVTSTANFAGFVAPNIIDITSPSGMVMIASASAMSSTAMAIDTGGYDFSLTVVGGTQLWLQWQLASIHALITSPLTPNQQAVANYLDAMSQAGPGPELQALLDAIRGLPNEAEIIAALDRLHPEHYLAQVNDTLHSSLFFLSSIMSCPTADGSYAIIAEDQCVWAKVGGRSFEQDRTWTNIGGDVEAWNVSAGAQVALQGNWRLGFAGSYEQTSIKTNNAAYSDGERLEGGVVLKNRWGDTTLAAAAFGGYGWFDTTRSIALAGIATAEGEHDIAFGGVYARLSHLLAQGAGWYVKPLIDLNATYISYGGFTEATGGAATLVVAGSDDWVLSATPALELGGEWRLSKTMLARPYVKAGVTLFDDAEFTLTSSFLSAPVGVAPFTVASDFDTVFFDVSAGVDVLSAGGVNVKLNYDGRFSEHSDSHAGGAKVGVQF